MLHMTSALRHLGTHARTGQTTADRATDDSGRWPADTERPVLGEKHWVLHAPREPHPLEPSGDLDPALFANEPPLLEVRAPRRATDNAHLLSSHRTTPSSSRGRLLPLEIAAVLPCRSGYQAMRDIAPYRTADTVRHASQRRADPKAMPHAPTALIAFGIRTQLFGFGLPLRAPHQATRRRAMVYRRYAGRTTQESLGSVCGR
jgi:hypothetical protein